MAFPNTSLRLTHTRRVMTHYDPPVLARPTPRALPRRRRVGDTPRVTTRHDRARRDAWARPIDGSRPSIDPHSTSITFDRDALVHTLRLAMKTTTKKTSTVKKTATPAKKTVSRAKPAAKRPAEKAPAKKASGGAPRADLDAVRAWKHESRDARA